MKKFDYAAKNYGSASRTTYDEGLRQYFLKIYALMSSGLAITAVTAFAIFSTPALTQLMFNISPAGYLQGMTGIGMIISFAPLAISLYFAFGSGRMSADTARTLFWVYAALMGASLASLIAWDTQKLKALYFNGADDKSGIMAAFTLYLDFINLFIYLLRFFGVRKENE